MKWHGRPARELRYAATPVYVNGQNSWRELSFGISAGQSGWYTLDVSDKPYRVHIVLDRLFGDRLMELPIGEPVWVVNSPANAPIVRRIWNERPKQNHLVGVTIFNSAAESPEAILVSELDTIDLHHGEHSANPPYSAAFVYGVNWTPAVAKAFAEVGFKKLNETSDGFIAEREKLSN